MALKISERNLKNKKKLQNGCIGNDGALPYFYQDMECKIYNCQRMLQLPSSREQAFDFQKQLHEAHSSTIYFQPTPLPPKKKIGSSKNICWNLGSSSRSWGISTSGSSSTPKDWWLPESYCNSDAKTTKVPCFVYGFDLFRVMVITSMVFTNANCDIMLYIYIFVIFCNIL